jgi:YHS domain-containing protein
MAVALGDVGGGQAALLTDEYLTATYLLAQSGGKYYFCMPHLRDKLRQTEEDMEFTVASLAREYREFQ